MLRSSMSAPDPSGVSVLADDDALREDHFERLSALIHEEAGIKLPSAKRVMLEGRLRKRLRALGYRKFDDYCRFLFDQNGLAQEFTQLIDIATTNKTDFFREPDHFDYLTRRIVPELLERRQGGPPHLIKAWSAASSIGAEAYTLAMVLADLSSTTGRFGYSILGTDISTEVLAVAERAVYPEEMIAPVPAQMQKRYIMRSRDPANPNVRIVPELRKRVRFRHLNLMHERYPVDHDVDVIFLRNVLIYFAKPTQIEVVRRLMGHLRPGGYLILGHSESMIGSSLNLRQKAPSVFQNPDRD